VGYTKVYFTANWYILMNRGIWQSIKRQTNNDFFFLSTNPQQLRPLGVFFSTVGEGTVGLVNSSVWFGRISNWEYP